MTRSFFGLFSFVAANGCAEAGDDGVEFRTTATTTTTGGWGCGTCTIGGNSPAVNGFPIPDLQLDGTANAAGVTVGEIVSPADVTYRLDVTGLDEFAARDSHGALVATGVDLIGWTIYLETPDGRRPVVIADYEPAISSWADNGAVIGAYALAFEMEGSSELFDVCTAAVLEPGETAVTLLLGERYDADAIQVVADATGWVTLACRGQAAAKMKLMNYGPQDDLEFERPATPEQRQATLKMLTADYCGDGHSFTVQGQPILWKNFSGHVDSSDEPTALEALWDDRGALCLDVPRHVDRKDVAERCTIPTCDEYVFPSNGIEWRTEVQ